MKLHPSSEKQVVISIYHIGTLTSSSMRAASSLSLICLRFPTLFLISSMFITSFFLKACMSSSSTSSRCSKSATLRERAKVRGSRRVLGRRTQGLKRLLRDLVVRQPSDFSLMAARRSLLFSSSTRICSGH